MWGPREKTAKGEYVLFFIAVVITSFLFRGLLLLLLLLC